MTTTPETTYDHLTAAESTTMQANVHDSFGAPRDALSLQVVDQPAIGDDEVLVRVHAAGVAIGDWLTTVGVPYVARPMYGLRKPKHRVGGHEFAGSVAAVGERVTEYHPGDEVYGFGNGSFAEFVAVAESSLASKPTNLTFEHAAAVPISGLAALEALRDTGNVGTGQKVLIVGASGAVGTFAVQIAKALGAEVTGVAGTRNLELVASIGADHVIDYTTEDIAEGGPRYDVILDLAGNRSLANLRAALAPQGTLVIVGGSGGKWLMGFGRTIRAALLSPFIGQQLRSFISKPSSENLTILSALIEAGDVTPVIDRTFPLSETAEAVTYVGERHSRGKSVITV